MPYSPAHKERVRRNILAEAAASIRIEGPDNIRVAAIMGKLGLTHGGFYAHFRSRDDLIAQAITEMFNTRYAGMIALTEGREPAEALSLFIDDYLDPKHRDDLAGSCAVAALASYVPRLPDAARARFVDGRERIERYVVKLLAKLGHDQPEDVAAAGLATLVGAICISRTMDDKGASDATLRVARAAARTQFGLQAN